VLSFWCTRFKEGGWLRVYRAREMTKEERGKFRHKK